MEALMKTRRATIFILVSLPIIANSEPVTYTGVVKTELPQLTIAPSEKLISDVKEFSIKPTKDAGICRLISDEALAKDHASRYKCLIKWSPTPGTAQDHIGITGLASGAGLRTFTYSLFLFDGGEFKPFYEGQTQATFDAPIPPSQPTVLSSWAIREPNLDTAHDLFNRKEQLSKIKLTSEKRNYDQVAHFSGSQCTIREDNDSCEIELNKDFLLTETEAGTERQPFYVVDKYGFFKPDAKEFSLSWDFRPPEIVKYFVNTTDNRLPMIINDYGEPFVLYPDQAAVVVTSPHATKPGDWWYPTDPSLKLSVADGFNMTKTLRYEENPVTFNLQLRDPKVDFIATPVGKPKKINEHLIYTYDFQSVEDGLYDFTLSTLDINSNGKEEIYTDVSVDRLPPDLQFVVNKKQSLSKTVNIYSLSDLTAMTWGGWPDGSEIFEATINGEPAEFVGGLPHIRKLEAKNLEINSINLLIVKARDSIGNQISKSIKFHFANYSFLHKAIDAFKAIESAKIELSQKEGLRCIYASSPELASIFSVSTKHRGCTVTWQELPLGMEPVLPNPKGLNSYAIASGIMPSEGSFSYKFNINTHDYYGGSLKVYEGSGTLNVLPVKSPELIVGVPHIVENFGEDYVYSKNYRSQTQIPYQLKKSTKANVTVQLIDPSGQVVLNKEHKTSLPDITTRASYLDANELPVTLKKYKVRAFYTNQPDVFTEKTINIFTTPDQGTRLYVNHEKTIFENSKFQIFANIARSENGVYKYTPEMGVWDIYLAKIENRTYVPVTEKIRTDLNGQSVFLFDANEITENHELQVVADFVSPYPEVSARRISNSLLAVNVLRLSSINAELSTPEVSLPVPATFVIKTEFLEKIDQASSGQVRWEISDDGSTWSELPSKSEFIYAHKIDEVKSQFIRASIAHAVTNELSYTNVIKLTAYKYPELNLTGNTTVVAGALTDFYHTISDYTESQSAGVVEWSLDDELTWQPMGQHERIAINKDQIINARILVKNEDATLPDFFVYDSIKVDAINPIALRPILKRSAYRLETGEQIEFTAKIKEQPYYPQDSIRYAYVLPSGQELSDLNLTHVLNETDFVSDTANFQFRAWVDGIKEQTMTTVKLPVHKIIYAFPATRMTVNSLVKVKNTPFTASIEGSFSKLPSTVSIAVDWFLPPGVEVIRTYPGNKKILLSMSEIGVHNIKASVSDNRGNSIEHQQLTEALDIPPMVIDLVGISSSEHMRPPMNYFLRTKINLGHSKDRVQKLQWSIDGEQIQGANSSVKIFDFTKPGIYKLSVDVETTLGQKQTASMNLEVLKNKPPRCSPFTDVRDHFFTINANCSDEDGRISNIEYRYLDKGEPRLIRSSSQTIIFNSRLQPSIDAQIKAFDDSGDFVETSLQYSGK